MRIAVCDDSDIDREIECMLLREVFAGGTGRSAPTLMPYSSGHVLLDDILEGEWYDIVMLDIYMENHLGIDIARKLRESGYKGAIVFLTSTPEFAVDGYDVSAAGYILKPANAERLSEVLLRIAQNIEDGSYTVRRRSTLLRIPYGEILFVESSNNKCILHRFGGECHNIYKRLDVIEAELSDKRFLRCSQSYIVNMDYIAKADRSFHLTTGDIVQIRQRGLKAMQDAYYSYIGGRSARPGD